MSDGNLREFLVRKLTDNVMHIVFVKANEEKREMKCTLRSDILPPPPVSKSQETREEKSVNLDTIRCWDIDKEGWRSFRLDSIISYDVIEEAA